MCLQSKHYTEVPQHMKHIHILVYNIYISWYTTYTHFGIQHMHILREMWDFQRQIHLKQHILFLYTFKIYFVYSCAILNPSDKVRQGHSQCGMMWSSKLANVKYLFKQSRSSSLVVKFKGTFTGSFFLVFRVE